MNPNKVTGIKGIHHIAMVVPSLARAREFYIDVLGLELVDQNHFSPSPSTDAMTELLGAECDMIMLKASNLYIEMFEFQSPKATRKEDPRLCEHGFTHLAFEVDDVQQTWDRLAKEGVRWHQPPVEITEGYVMCYGRDPFGNVIEIQQVATSSVVALDKLALGTK